MILPRDKPGDVVLYYEIHGEGTPLLLIAGLGSDCLSWGGVVAKLAAHFKVIVFDNRGVGRSEAPEKSYAVGEMTSDAIRLLDHLKIKKAHILGHSMGGFIAQEMAIHHPERVERLVLASTAAVSSERNNTLFLEFYKELRTGADPETWILKWVRWLFSPERLSCKTFIDAFVKNRLKDPFPQQARGLKGQIDAIALFDSREKLGRVKAETLVLHGREDILILPGEAEALAKGISGSAFQYIKGAAHCLHIENRHVFVRAVVEFLERNQVPWHSQKEK